VATIQDQHMAAGQHMAHLNQEGSIAHHHLDHLAHRDHHLVAQHQHLVQREQLVPTLVSR